jgi:hypothetical protein
MAQPPVRAFAEDSVEHRAYASVEGIPFLEMNDRNRLGYHVFLYLTGQFATLREAVHVAQARMNVSDAAACAMIAERLRAGGASVEE